MAEPHARTVAQRDVLLAPLAGQVLDIAAAIVPLRAHIAAIRAATTPEELNAI